MDVLIEFEKQPLLFLHPDRIIPCFHPQELPYCFEEIEQSLDKGYFVAGFFSYEAGYAFEKKLFIGKSFRFPLAYFGCYRRPYLNIQGYLSDAKAYSLGSLRANISQELYDSNIESIRSFISAGDVYQITYCLKLLFSVQGSTYSLYRKLLRDHPVPYPAFIHTDQFDLLSLSPEMFLKKKDTFISTKPMKGTWPRSKKFFNDVFSGYRLKHDQKNRAENVMIADLLRNDLGRICRNIQVPRLFEVARYATLCQMTSTVTAEIDREIRFFDLLQALFPSGSVTGAPKIRAMEIIRELEKEERNIYTGTIGYITPNRDMFFNIPIRTLLVEGERGELGIGGGIVWDSTPQGEWDEGLLKARFLTDLISFQGA